MIDNSSVFPLSSVETGKRSIRAVLDELDATFGRFSVDELMFMRRPALTDELRALGVSQEEAFAPPAGLPADWTVRLTDVLSRSPPPVPRTRLVETFAKTIAENRVVSVTGPAGTGKSVLLQRLFADFGGAPRVIRVDCASLRMTDAVQFSRNACWALFGGEEDAFRRFAGECAVRDRLDPLLTILEHRLAGGGVLVLDHMEHVKRCEGIDQFLTEKLIWSARQADFRVVFCDRSMRLLRKFSKLSSKLGVEFSVGNFDAEELSDWLELPFFARFGDRKMNPADLLKATGGSPRLLRDFANFVVMDSHADGQTLAKFLERRPQEYVAHCERLMWAKRTLPALLLKDVEELDITDLPQEERAEICDTLCASGVVKQIEAGRFAYVSPIHRERAKLLSAPAVLSLALLRATSVESLNSKNHPVQLRKCAEVAVDPLMQFLSGERSARIALEKLRAVLHSWGFRATIYLRDRNNARLFLELVRNGDRMFPLQDDEFLHAVQTGRSAVTEGEEGAPEELLVPVVGYTGTVELVLKGPFAFPSMTTYLKEIQRDRFVNLLRGLKPTLSQVVERFWAGRDRRLAEKFIYGPHKRDKASVWQNVLEAVSDAQPAALVVLRRLASGWSVASFERGGRRPDQDRDLFNSSSWAEPMDEERLDRVAVHPSQHGLVLGHEDANAIFPKLVGQKDAAVYVRPVWFDKECRLVVFMFKRAPAGGLDGNVQQRLWIAAPAIAAVC